MTSTADNGVFIRREPVINRHRAIIATRLVVHADTAAAAAQTLGQLGDVWPATRSIMVALAGCMPSQELLAWTPPANTIIEIPAATLANPDSQALIAHLHANGTALSLSGFDAQTILPAAPFRFLLADSRTLPRIDNPPALPLAQHLADQADFDTAIANGYAGAAGWFFLRHIPPHGALQTNHAQAVRVLNLVRKNAPVGEIEDAMKHDVMLSFKLLRYINSPGFGLGKEIHSFRHAVTLLGYDKLNKWLSLLLVTASKSPVAPALMQTAIARGRLMELVGASRFLPDQRDNLFITGAFSLLDILLAAPMDAILAEMQLPEQIAAALTNRTGEFAPYLALALACENEDPAAMMALAGQLGLTAATLNCAQLEALAFADSMQADE